MAKGPYSNAAASSGTSHSSLCSPDRRSNWQTLDQNLTNQIVLRFTVNQTKLRGQENPTSESVQLQLYAICGAMFCVPSTKQRHTPSSLVAVHEKQFLYAVNMTVFSRQLEERGASNAVFRAEAPSPLCGLILRSATTQISLEV